MVDSSIVEDAETKSVVDFYGADLHAKMAEGIGVMEVPLDGRFARVRTEETNLGEVLFLFSLSYSSTFSSSSSTFSSSNSIQVI